MAHPSFPAELRPALVEEPHMDLSGLALLRNLLGTLKRTDELSSLPIPPNQETFEDDGSRLCGVSLSGLSPQLQRENRHALQLSRDADRHRFSGRVVPAPLQTEPAGSGSNVLD